MERTTLLWRKSSYSSNTGACVEVAQGWRKSSYSGDGPSCVEVADAHSHVHVRDTQNRPLGHLTFPGADWNALLAALRGGTSAS